jgi:hypothetical protein
MSLIPEYAITLLIKENPFNRMNTYKPGLLLILVIMLGILTAEAQVAGCTDVQASNFNPDATINDGSCVYPVTQYAPTLITNLPNILRETSGLALAGPYIWTHNDSGGLPVLYALDTTSGNLQRECQIGQATAIDWEDISHGDQYMYIGDIGNNAGTRRDLRFYIIPLEPLLDETTQSAEASVIDYYYEDQTDFSPRNNNHNYDAEAFFYRADTLHLFSKNWVDLGTRYYTIPAHPGEHVAELRDSFWVDGLITGAAVSDSGVIVLCGYKPVGFGLYTCFAWLLWDYPPQKPFGGNKRRLELGTPLTLAQLEAIEISSDLKGWMSGEAIASGPLNIPARLHQFDFSDYVQNLQNSTSSARYDLPHWKVYPNPASVQFHLETDDLLSGHTWWLHDIFGKIKLHGQISQNIQEINTASLQAGIYLFRISGAAAVQIILIE